MNVFLEAGPTPSVEPARHASLLLSVGNSKGFAPRTADYRDLATAVLREIGDQIRRYPSGFGYALSAVDFLLSTPKEVAIVGKDEADFGPLLAETWRKYIPNKVVAPGFGMGPIPLLENRAMINGLATAYVCEHFTCKKPVTEVSALREQLDS